MAVSERERRKLQEALVGTIGPEPTDTLLGYLPPVGWADVATRRDLDAASAELRGEIRRLDGKIDALDARLNGRIDALAAATMGKFAEVEGRFAEVEGSLTALQGRIDGVAGSLEAKIERGFKVLVFWMVSLQLAAVGAILGLPAVLHR